MLMLLVASVVFPGFTLVKSTSRADYYVPTDQPKLKVDARQCDAFVAKLEHDLGVTVPHFTYRRVKDAAGVYRELHIAGASGGADSEAMMIVSMETCHRHEIIHLATAQLSRPGKVFEEGIATALSAEYSGLEQRTARKHAKQVQLHYESTEALFERDVASTTVYRDQYRLSNAWIRYLIKAHGLSMLAEFFRIRSSVSTDGEAFHIVYGTDLGATFDQWLYGTKGASHP